jgi:hypothetical protein
VVFLHLPYVSSLGNGDSIGDDKRWFTSDDPTIEHIKSIKHQIYHHNKTLPSQPLS